MGLFSHAAQRLVMIMPTLLGASFIIFVLTMLIPGDPARIAQGPRRVLEARLEPARDIQSHGQAPANGGSGDLRERI